MGTGTDDKDATSLNRFLSIVLAFTALCSCTSTAQTASGPGGLGNDVPNLEVFQSDYSPSPPRSSSDLARAKALVLAIEGGAKQNHNCLVTHPT